MNDDERISRLLQDTVAGVEPREALHAIRARTEAGQARRPWLWGAGAAVLATAATIAAVALVGGDTGTGGDDHAATSPTPSVVSPTPTPSPTPSTARVTVPAYYVGDTSRGPRLYREFHAASGDKLAAAVREAVAGTPADPDYRTAWPGGTTVRSASYDGDVLTVDLGSPPSGSLRGRPDGMGADLASMAVEQVVYTAQAALGKGRVPVQLLLDGGHTDTVLGVPAAEPLAQGDAADVLAQVWVIEPAEGARLHSGFTVSGLAAAFEANVQWELKQGDRVVRSGFTTAEQCCTMAPYSFTVTAPPGDYTLVVHDSDASGGEGFAPWQDTKTVTVLP